MAATEIYESINDLSRKAQILGLKKHKSMPLSELLEKTKDVNLQPRYENKCSFMVRKKDREPCGRPCESGICAMHKPRINCKRCVECGLYLPCACDSKI